jgi:hypothetical protein
MAYRAVVWDVTDDCRGSVAGFGGREGGAIEAVVADAHADDTVAYVEVSDFGFGSDCHPFHSVHISSSLQQRGRKTTTTSRWEKF